MLSDLKKHATLLIVLVILVVVKFIVVPIIEWQEGLILENESYQSRIDRVQGLSENRERLQQSLNTVEKQQQLAQSLVHQYSDEATFKLKLQKLLDSYAAKYNVKVSNVNWLTTVEMIDGAIIKFPIRMKVRGPTSKVVQFINYLESLSPIIDVDALNLNVKRQSGRALGSIDGQLTINLYMGADS